MVCATMKRKREHEKVVRINICLDPKLLVTAETMIRGRGFTGLSDYVRCRIRQDAGIDVAQPIVMADENH